jgi:carbohydrate-binding DOMON domain-containing protein
MISQIAIMIFGASAIWFVSRTEKWKRWGYILGLCGQPFWIYTTIK